MHFACAGLFLLKEVIDSSLYVNAELGRGQLPRAEFVLFPLGALLLEAVITAEAQRPDLVVVQHADLVLLAPAVHAHHERLLLQVVVLHLFELVLFYCSGMTIVIISTLIIMLMELIHKQYKLD